MARKNYSIKTRNLVIRPLEMEEMKNLSFASSYVEACEGLEEEEYFWSCLWEMKDRKSGEAKGHFHFDGVPENYEERVVFLDTEASVLKEAIVEICNVLVYGDHGIHFVLVEAKDEAEAKVLEEKGFSKKGEDGVYEYAKPRNSMLSFGISIGMCFGVALGTAFGNIAMGLPVGMLFGVAFGAFIDGRNRSRWAEVDENRE